MKNFDEKELSNDMYNIIELNKYLEKEGFYHLIKDSYSVDELDFIMELLDEYNNIDKSNINLMVNIATNWWVSYLMKPVFKDDSQIKIILRLIIAWQTAYHYNYSIKDIEEIKRKLKSRIKTVLIKDGKVVINGDRDSILQEVISLSNDTCLDFENIEMLIDRKKILVWTNGECQTLYYNYTKSKKK